MRGRSQAIVPNRSNFQKDSLEELIEMAEQSQNGILLDEAYEMYHSPSVSGLEYVQDLENSNIFLAGACTKGLQCPGIALSLIQPW